MRLVIATPLYPPEIGGPATYAKLLTEGFPRKGIKVEIVKFSDVRRLPKLLRHYAYYRRVLRAAHAADAILALDPISVGLPAAFAAKRMKKPLVIKIVGDYAWEQGQQRFGVTDDLDAFVATRQRSLAVRLLQGLERWVAKRAVRVIVPSIYLKQIVMTWRVPQKKIEVIHNAVGLDELGEAPETVRALAKPLVVTVGRLVPWKGFALLVDAVHALRDRGLDASLAIVGEGPLHEELRERAGTKLGGACVLTGALSHEDTLATIARADVFVLNSTYEGLSHTLVEAARLGVPILATAVGGNAEIVRDGESGVLIPAGDVARLADALAVLLENAPLRTRLGVNAKLAGAAFSKETLIDSTAALLTAFV